jgi:hypothetical protein
LASSIAITFFLADHIDLELGDVRIKAEAIILLGRIGALVGTAAGGGRDRLGAAQ